MLFFGPKVKSKIGIGELLLEKGQIAVIFFREIRVAFLEAIAGLPSLTPFFSVSRSYRKSAVN